jgi:hypothetical protein
VGGCTCAAPPATKVSLNAKNTLDWDIFVPDTAGEGGLAVQHPPSPGADATLVPEGAPCPCLGCDVACAQADSCNCTQHPKVRRIRAGKSFSRDFLGNEHAATRADCGAGDLGPICYQTGVPIPAGGYRLHFCYAPDAPGASANQDEFESTLPEGSLTCVDKTFEYPTDTSVEIETVRPPPCGADRACPSGQICQRGVCSATCLASGVPPLGATWSTSVTLSDNEALFVGTGSDPLRQTATATVGAASYAGDDLTLALSQQLAHGRATGTVRISLAPGTPVVPMAPGETVTVLVVTSDSRQSSAATVRDANGNLLLAADQGLGGPLLTSADLTPFSVSTEGQVFACDQSDACGKRFHRLMTFTAGTTSVDVEAGKTETLPGPSGTFAATSVANSKDERGTPENCGPEPVTAFDLVLSNRSL